MTNRGDHHTITTHPVLVLTHRVFVVVKEDFILVQLYTIGGASVNLNKLLFPYFVFTHSVLILILKVVLYYYSTIVPLPQRDRISEGLKSRCQPRGLSWLVPPDRIALLWLLCICTYLCICLMVYLCICVIHWAELVS